MVKSKNVINPGSLYSLKKCPYCFTMLKLEADRCDRCKKKVGALDRAGFAQKRINWKAYGISIFAWAVFAVYVWWAFFSK